MFFFRIPYEIQLWCPQKLWANRRILLYWLSLPKIQNEETSFQMRETVTHWSQGPSQLSTDTWQTMGCATLSNFINSNTVLFLWIPARPFAYLNKPLLLHSVHSIDSPLWPLSLTTAPNPVCITNVDRFRLTAKTFNYLLLCLQSQIHARHLSLWKQIFTN